MKHLLRCAVLALTLAVALASAPAAASATNAGRATKVTVCHARADGTILALNVSRAALPAFLKRGDRLPGDEASPGYIFDEACKPVRACVGEGSFHGTFVENGFRYPMTMTMRCGDVGEVIADVEYPVFGQCAGTWTLIAVVDANTIQVSESINEAPCETGWVYQVTYDPETDQWLGFYLTDPANTFRLRRD